MKEATGSTSMLYVLLIFLSVFITFIAVAFNYARAFKVKNTIIDIIERNEGIDNVNTNGAREEIEQYLDDIRYSIPQEKFRCDDEYNYINEQNDNNGYCIGKPDYVSESGRDEIYYTVETFATIDFPFVNLTLFIPVKGETRIIVNENTIIIPEETPTYEEPEIPTQNPHIHKETCDECTEYFNCLGKLGRWDPVNKTCIL